MPARLALFLFLWSAGCALHTPGADRLRPLASVPSSDISSAEQILFLVVGDAGRGNPEQKQVGAWMAKLCESRRPGRGCDFALAPGDLIYENGVNGVDDPKFRTHFETPFQDLGRLPFWSVPGNHDWHRPDSVQAQIDYTARSDRWRMPFHHFELPNLPGWLHIYGVDTTVMFDVARARGADRTALLGLTGKQVEAAQSALCGKSGWRLLFGHHPFYSSGQHGFENGSTGALPAIASALLEPVIRKCNVQVYIAGHDHLQEFIRVESPPFAQVTQGAGAEVRSRKYPFRVPGVASEFLAHKLGFALITVDAATMKIEYFGFAKGDAMPAAGPAPVFEKSLTP